MHTQDAQPEEGSPAPSAHLCGDTWGGGGEDILLEATICLQHPIWELQGKTPRASRGASALFATKIIVPASRA